MPFNSTNSTSPEYVRLICVTTSIGFPLVLLDLCPSVTPSYGGQAEIEAHLPRILGLGSFPYWCPRTWKWLSRQSRAQLIVVGLSCT